MESQILVLSLIVIIYGAGTWALLGLILSELIKLNKKK